EHFRSCDELGYLVVRALAEGADQIVLGVARTPNPMPPTPAGVADHLLYTLMAQLQRVGDVPQGAASQMHSADDRVVLNTSQFHLTFRVGELGSRSQGFFKQLLANCHKG